jgi:hypothetical protein
MSRHRILSAILAALFAIAPAWATSTYQYAKDEYVIIRDGLAPNQQMSLAAHGDGEGGDGNFHVWLMAEPAHRRIVPLADIEARLDTGADAYRAVWSADSRHVAVSFRIDRHETQLNLYRIENRRAHPVLGPSLFRDVTNRNIGAQDNIRESFSEIVWRGPKRFVLREHHLFVAPDPGFVRGLGSYGRKAGAGLDGPFVEFSTEADCVLLPGHRYRIVDLRVGKFVD